MLPEGRAYSRHFCQFVRPTIHPSITFLSEHVSKSIEGNLMKLDTLLEVHGGIAEYKNHNPVTSIYGVTSLHNFCNKKLVRSISLKV